jgi:hypothetical protein
MKARSVINAVLGISTELAYALAIIGAVFLLCLAIYFKQ